MKKLFHRKEEKVSTTPNTLSTTGTSATTGTTGGSNLASTTASNITNTAESLIAPAGTTAPTTYSSAFTAPQTATTSAGGEFNPLAMETQQYRHIQSGAGGMGPGTMISSSMAQGPQITQPEVQMIRKQPVIQEMIQQVEKDVIQPVVHREREQTEIHQITQPMTQVEVRPAVVEEKILPAEMRPVIREQPKVIIPDVQLRSSTVTAPPSVSVIQENPIVEEIVHRVIREEIQPVVYKQTVVPTVVHQQKPIFERIIEAPLIFKEERAPIILGDGVSFTNMLGQQPKLESPLESGQGGGSGFLGQPPVSVIDRKLQNVSLDKVPTTVRDTVTTTTTTVEEPVGRAATSSSSAKRL